ncbi:hypothetical protein JTE90_003988 [Oedothorax gibbosus]|uniref:Uncharacterized protein n=1 Tax=Oedothorax gibbosus TaxID=931172 RepID=A0AAV6UDW3_9ARAC|nr:hypothetical protein JTE90_003988 [Oedothorax gibbosus]
MSVNCTVEEKTHRESNTKFCNIGCISCLRTAQKKRVWNYETADSNTSVGTQVLDIIVEKISKHYLLETHKESNTKSSNIQTRKVSASCTEEETLKLRDSRPQHKCWHSSG